MLFMGQEVRPGSMITASIITAPYAAARHHGRPTPRSEGGLFVDRLVYALPVPEDALSPC